MHADVAVIGLGSAGEVVAATVADAGRRVVAFEPGRVGGECPFVACMPSKAMLHDAAIAGDDWAGAVEHRWDVVEHLDDREHARDLTERGVVLVRAAARLAGPRTVVAGGDTYTADHVVLATGSRHRFPPVPGLDGPGIWTSDEALTTTERPGSLAVIGAGPIGSELSQVFRRFGAPVTTLEVADRLVPNAEPMVGDLLADALRADGVDLRLGVTVEGVAADDDGWTVSLDGGAEVTVGRVLVATGKAPVLDGLGLETVGVSTDEPLPVDDEGRVAGLDHLWAAGDVTGWAPFTHGANHQAEAVAAGILGRPRRYTDQVVPWAIYTDPAVAGVGRTAAQAAAAGLDVVVGEGRYHQIARYSTDRLFDGAVFVVADRATGHVVGLSGIGRAMDELVVLGAAAIDAGIPLDVLARLIHPFPTIGQVVQVALRAAASRLTAP